MQVRQVLLGLVISGLVVLGWAQSAAAEQLVKATFAGGCFWCMEHPFDELNGVKSTTVGYAGGSVKNPTYQQVSAGKTGHTEAIEIVYDPALVSYETLLEVFWQNIDPLDSKGQFCDKGSQYRTAIFFHDPEQQQLAEQSRATLVADIFEQPIATEIVPATEFYEAEEYHQDYYLKNPFRYGFYRYACGRDQRLEELWSNVDLEELVQR